MNNSQLSWCLGKFLYSTNKGSVAKFQGIVVSTKEISEWEIEILTPENKIKKLKLNWFNEGVGMINQKGNSTKFKIV